MADTSFGEQLWETAKAGAGFLADVAAAKEPLIGMPLQVLTNSPEYQDRGKKREILNAQYQQAKEFNSPQAAELRKKQLALNYAQTNAKLFETDKAHEENAINKYRRDFIKNDLNKPQFAHLNDEEKLSFTMSPEAYSMFELRYLSDMIQQSYDTSNPEQQNLATDMIYRNLVRSGYSLEERDGKTFLNMGNGNVKEITKDFVESTREQLYKGAMEELAFRQGLSYENTKNSPQGRLVAQRANATRNFNNNSCKKSVQRIQAITNQHSDEEQKIAVINQALKDFESSDLSPQNRLNNLMSLFQQQLDPEGKPLTNEAGMAPLPILKHIGFDVDIPQEWNGDLNTLTFRKNGESRPYAFSDFKQYIKENDKLGRALDADYLEQKRNFERTQISKANRAMAQTAKAVAGKDTPESDKHKFTEQHFLNAVNRYGEEAETLDESGMEKLQKVEKRLRLIAKGRNLLTDGNNKPKVKTSTTLDDLRKMAMTEQSIFENAGLEGFAKRGYWNTLYNIKSQKIKDFKTKFAKENTNALNAHDPIKNQTKVRKENKTMNEMLETRKKLAALGAMQLN